MLVSEFDYELPAELIAQHPPRERRGSRLLHLRADGAIDDLAFSDLPRLVDERDALVLNDTRVIKARLAGRKASGGRIELFVERIVAPREALALIRASHPPAAGSALLVGEAVHVTVVSREEDLYRVAFDEGVEGVLERFGAVPLPPYISHHPDAADTERYQTVYARAPGAVAAPTAGLHFDRALLAAIEARGAALTRLTLHVGAGTFQPVRSDRGRGPSDAHGALLDSRSDTMTVARKIGACSRSARPSLRALESAARSGELEGRNRSFIIRASGSASSSGCSPTSTCRSPRC